MELYVPKDDRLQQLIGLAQQQSNQSNWPQVLEVLKDVNSLLFDGLIEACGFVEVHPYIDRNLVSVLDVLYPLPFIPRIVIPNHSFTLESAPDIIRKTNGVRDGTAGQFLSYLIRDKSVGIKRTVAFPPQAGVSMDLGEPASLYIHKQGNGRRLGLANMNWDRRNSSWGLFGVQV
jgi:hypothetical protein